jgi:phosphoribosylformylglycinamidine synthase
MRDRSGSGVVQGGLSRNYDAVELPGGFPCGDYLRAGAVAARTPVIKDVVPYAGNGGFVTGFCNGAKIPSESGPVPGVLVWMAAKSP